MARVTVTLVLDVPEEEAQQLPSRVELGGGLALSILWQLLGMLEAARHGRLDAALVKAQ
jgi:hypothetical protein